MMMLDFAADVAHELTEATAVEPVTVRDIAARCEALAADGGVDAHSVPFRPGQWRDWRHVFPADTQHRGAVTRAQVRQAVTEAVAASAPLDALAAVYIWGQGRNGYARTRFDAIVTGREAEVEKRIRAALDHLSTADPVGAYAQLWGGAGRVGETRATPRSPSWNRIDKLGPAFFTKILYFADRRALILDQVLARRIAALSSLPHFIGKRGRAAAWHPFRYAVYLEWMSQTAALIDPEASVEVTPDLLELALFRPASKATENEGDAGH